jgi:hypothetical protein
MKLYTVTFYGNWDSLQAFLVWYVETGGEVFIEM